MPFIFDYPIVDFRLQLWEVSAPIEWIYLSLKDLSGELKAEWLDVGRYLNVSDTSLHNVKVDNTGNVKEAKYQMLIFWKEANGQKATLTSLANALLRAGRKDLSEKVKHGNYLFHSELRLVKPYLPSTAMMV